jgi:hypothetical protein
MPLLDYRSLRLHHQLGFASKTCLVFKILKRVNTVHVKKKCTNALLKNAAQKLTELYTYAYKNTNSNICCQQKKKELSARFKQKLGPGLPCFFCKLVYMNGDRIL